MPIDRTLLLLHAKSGVGLRDEPEALRRELEQSRGATVELALATSHAHASELARDACAASPVAIVVGGGGGTLRSCVEGVLAAHPSEMPSADRVRLLPLRHGSGNLASRALGWPADTHAALALAGRALQGDAVVPWAIVRAEMGDRRMACVSFGGLGEWGKVPGDVARGPRSRPRLRRAMSSLLRGVERVNQLEHVACVARRAIRAAASPSALDRVHVEHAGWRGDLRLLSGFLMRQDVPGLPWPSGLRRDEAAAMLHLLPWRGRAASFSAWRPGAIPEGTLSLRIDEDSPATVTLLEPASSEMHLDEDPEPFVGTLRLSIPGSLAFVPTP